VLLHFAPYPILLALGKKDPVMNYAESIDQIENTSVKLVTLPGGHMGHIESRKTLLHELQEFLKNC
jgi:predicted alpha/beta-fold hydrolase